MSDRNSAALFRAALKNAVDRWQFIGPTILYANYVDYPDGINAAEVNRLAQEAGLGGPVYTPEEGEESGNRCRWVTVHRPDGVAAVRWKSWSSGFPVRDFDLDPRNLRLLRPDKLRDTIEALEEWLALGSPEPLNLSLVVAGIVIEAGQGFLAAATPLLFDRRGDASPAERRAALALDLQAQACKARTALARAGVDLERAVDLTVELTSAASGLLVEDGEREALRRTGQWMVRQERAFSAAGRIDAVLRTAAEAGRLPRVDGEPPLGRMSEAPPRAPDVKAAAPGGVGGTASMSEIDLSYLLPRLPVVGLPAYRALESAGQRLSACLMSMTFADAQAANGRERMADALLSFWDALHEAVRATGGSPADQRDRLNDVHDLKSNVTHPQSAAATNLFQAGAGYSGVEGDRMEKAAAVARNLDMIFSGFRSYGAGSPDAKWGACRKIIPVYTAALLAAFQPVGLQDDAAALDAMRRAIKHAKDGKKEAVKNLVKAAGIAEQRARDALRKMEALGEYDGFSRKPPRRRQ